MESKNWTIFLDRDGVINKRRINTYLSRWSDFEFIDKSDHAIVELSKMCKRILVVTNQQGVAKGMTTHFELDHLHYCLGKHIESMGGHIDRIYYCPDHEIYEPICRKPRPGMAMQAMADFPDIDLQKSMMVGDFYTDILMGQQMGMKTVFIDNDRSIWKETTAPPDFSFANLWAFSQALDDIIA